MSDKDIINVIAASLHKSHLEGIISFRGEAVSAFVALRSAGYAVVKLPEPDSAQWQEDDDDPPEDRLAWLYGHGLYGVSVWNPGEVQLAYDNEPGEPLSVSEAQQLAAALLAATEKAGEGK